MKSFLKLIPALWLSSCGHESHSPDYYTEVKSWNNNEIPWVDASMTESTNTKMGLNLAELMGEQEYTGNKGTSQENIYTLREATVQMVASMPYAMPFFCNPACYEASIIIGLQACQPYRFVIWYYYLSLPEDASPKGRRHSGYCRGR